MELFYSLDAGILLFIQEYIRHPVLTMFFTAITKLGDKGMIWMILTLFLLAFKKTRKIGVISICALLGSLLINNILLKNIVDRIRPYDAVSGLMPLITKPTDFSFPSGHTASSFAAAYVMYKRLPKKWGIPILLLAALIGFSRLYVGVHYPTDVLAGMFSGILIAVFVGRLVEAVWPDRDL